MKFLQTIILIALASVQFLSCTQSTKLGGYSNLKTDRRVSNIAILPFEPGDNFAQQAEGLMYFHLKKRSGMKFIGSDTLKAYTDLQYLYPSRLNNRMRNNICMRYGIDILVCGKTVSRSKYDQWSKKMKYDYDLEIKLIDSKGEVVGKYYLEKQKGKLKDGVKKISKKICEDMRWSAFIEESNDVFDLYEE